MLAPKRKKIVEAETVSRENRAPTDFSFQLMGSSLGILLSIVVPNVNMSPLKGKSWMGSYDSPSHSLSYVCGQAVESVP